MKVGDLVTYGDWYVGKQTVGLVVESADNGASWFFVMWQDRPPEWEDKNELIIINDRQWGY